MMDDATFLRASRVQIEASKRNGLPVSLDADHALRMLEMAERAGPRRQAAPVPGEGDVWAEVIASLEHEAPPATLALMRERRQVGRHQHRAALHRLPTSSTAGILKR